MKYEYVGEKKVTTSDQVFKMIIIGDSGVGKSCLMLRVVDNEFKSDHQVTIGVEFGSFGIKIKDSLLKL